MDFEPVFEGLRIVDFHRYVTVHQAWGIVVEADAHALLHAAPMLLKI